MNDHISRRAIVGSCATAFCGSLGGCIGPPNQNGATETGTNGDSTSQVLGTFGVRNHQPEDVVLSVEIRSNGEIVDSVRNEVLGSVGTSLDLQITEPGDYVIITRIEAGETTEYEWYVNGKERLLIHIVGNKNIRHEEVININGCEQGEGRTDDLPSDIGPGPETYTNGDIEIRNRSTEPIGISVSLSYENTTFFKCFYDIAGQQKIEIPDVVSDAGTYDVTVASDEDTAVTHQWTIPNDDNYPLLFVNIQNPNDIYVGCGEEESFLSTVINKTGERQPVSIEVRRDGETINETTESVSANAQKQIEMEVPIGDFYEIAAMFQETVAKEPLPLCYCYRHRQTEITLTGQGPDVETSTRICQ